MKLIESIKVSVSEKKYENPISPYKFSETKCENSRRIYIVSESTGLFDLGKERLYWNKALSEFAKHDNNIESLMDYIQSIKGKKDNSVKHRYENFFSKILDVYYEYNLETKKNKVNTFHTLSHHSLLQLLRFIPEFPERNLDVYLDEMTGCFGVTIKIKTSEKPILNLLMMENKEVIFSFIKRKNKIIKISGRAYFNDDLNDSDEIKNIIRMINP